MRRFSLAFLLKAPLLLGAEAAASLPAVGGQAVMEGVVMRGTSNSALAVRLPDGGILVERRPWLALPWQNAKKGRFFRGFPILMETLLNGISALNRSAELEKGDDEKPLSRFQLLSTLLLALLLALGLFVVLPHLLVLLLSALGWASSMSGLSFHLWDGLLKMFILVLYILLISLLPDIRRVFQYHGAEHKVISAFEAGGEVSARSALRHSRLHPRCGTTFLLFVLVAAVVMHALLLPPLLHIWQPRNAVLGNLVVLALKIVLLVPVSALAYEFIRLASHLGNSFWGRLLQAPGLFLQLMTTREPDISQLEVAVVALAETLGDEYADRIQTPAYSILE